MFAEIPKKALAAFLLFGLLILLTATSASAGWLPQGTPVCDAAGDQLDVSGCGDELGGMLLVWRDLRPGAQGVYAQRISPGGTMLWTTDGVLLSAIGSGASDPSIAPDGVGGAWVVWNDWINPHGSVAMQHLDATGTPDWAPVGGALIREGSGFFSPLRPECVRDGSGGVIVAWAEETNPRGGPLVSQRFDDTGSPLWTVPGVVVGDSILAGGEIDMVVHGQGDGGAVLAWKRPFSTPIIEQGRAQYVSAAGVPQWSGINGYSVGITVTGSRIRVAERHRFDNGAHILYQRAVSSPPGGTREWRVHAVADNEYQWWDSSAGADPDAGLDAAIYHDHDKGCVVAWYYVEPSTSEIIVTARRLEYSGGGAAWTQILGIDPALPTSAAPAAVYDGSYFGYRFVWPALVDGSPGLLYRTMGRGGEALPDPGAGEIAGADCTVTPVLSPGPAYTSPVLVGWRDERAVTNTDVYATALAYDGRIPYPDLEVRSFRSDPNPAEVTEPRQLRFVITNTGLADADDFSVAYWHDIVSPSGSSDYEWTIYDGLARGDSLVIDFEDPFVASNPTTWSSWVRSDFEGDVDEGPYEDDNDRQLIMDWVATVDLVVDNFDFTPSNPTVGELGHYDVTIRNAGHLAAGPFEVHVYHDRGTSPAVGEVGDEVYPVATLAPGATLALNTSDFTHDEADLWNSYAFVDAPNAVDESDEANNTAGPIAITWNLPEQEGWPVGAGTGALWSPVIASLPTNPPGLRSVLVTSSDGSCYAVDGMGHSLPGWPYVTTTTIHSSPAVHDLDFDGLQEVVFGDDKGIVHCVDAYGRLEWSYDAGIAVTATPVVARIVGGLTLTSEVLVGDTAGWLHLIDHEGNAVSGWPVRIGDEIVASPAVGNLDGTGATEIVAIARTTRPIGSAVHVLTPSGTSIGGGWPVNLITEFESSPALGDIVGDTRLEIVAGDIDGYLHGWTVDLSPGSFVTNLGAPIRAAVALADLDGHTGAKCEIVVATDVYVSTPPFGGYWHSTLWAVDGAGAALTGWPVDLRKGLADCRAGDGAIVWGEGKNSKIAIGTESGDCFVYDANGNRLPGSTMPANGAIAGSLAAGELDADGHLEIVVAGQGELRAYDLLAGSYAPHLMAWTMFGHEAQRTHCVGVGTVTAVGPDHPVSVKATRWLAPRPNPFNPSVTLPFELSVPGAVEIRIYDLAGREVRRFTWEQLGAGPHRVEWNGRDRRGKSVASGVYPVELRTHEVRARTRVVLVK